jgi:hypothetical protein
MRKYVLSDSLQTSESSDAEFVSETENIGESQCPGATANRFPG